MEGTKKYNYYIQVTEYNVRFRMSRQQFRLQLDNILRSPQGIIIQFAKNGKFDMSVIIRFDM